MAIVEIHDVGDPRLAVYRDLNRANLTPFSGRFIAESRFLVQRLLASSLTTESILCSERYRDEFQFLATSDLPVYVVPHTQMSDLVGFKFHRGMLACARRPPNAQLTQLVGMSEHSSLIVVCPHIVDPTNLAGVVRNCAAFGASGLLLGPHCADVYSRRVARVSMGTAFQMPVRVAEDLAADLRTLGHDWGYHRVATVLDSNATFLTRAQRTGRLAILFGGEGYGLEPCWQAICDEQVTLPMLKNTDSLNLATATGVFLYHYSHVASLKTTARRGPAEFL